MATYLELFELRSDSDLQDKICIAVIKKAWSLLDGNNPTKQKAAWASSAIHDPAGKANSLMNYVLAAESESTVEEIQSVSDATIQAHVDSAADALISGDVA